MIRLSLAAIAISFALTVAASAAPVLTVPLPGGYFDAEYFAGSGANTAYFVADFGGSGGGVHGFGYHWDGTQTADNAMIAIAAAGALDMTYNDFGSPGAAKLVHQQARRSTGSGSTDLQRRRPFLGLLFGNVCQQQCELGRILLRHQRPRFHNWRRRADVGQRRLLWSLRLGQYHAAAIARRRPRAGSVAFGGNWIRSDRFAASLLRDGNSIGANNHFGRRPRKSIPCPPND